MNLSFGEQRHGLLVQRRERDFRRLLENRENPIEFSIVIPYTFLLLLLITTKELCKYFGQSSHFGQTSEELGEGCILNQEIKYNIQALNLGIKLVSLKLIGHVIKKNMCFRNMYQTCCFLSVLVQILFAISRAALVLYSLY